MAPSDAPRELETSAKFSEGEYAVAQEVECVGAKGEVDIMNEIGLAGSNCLPLQNAKRGGISARPGRWTIRIDILISERPSTISGGK